MIRRALFLAVLFLFASWAGADESYLGIYLQNQKLGYAVSSVEDDRVAGKPMRKYVSKTVMNAGLLGQAMSVTIEQTSWSTPDGKPSLVKFLMSSAGRSQKVEANYLPNGVHLAIDNNGSKTKKTLPLPKDAPIVDDALAALLEGSVAVGEARKFYVLDPMTAAFVLNVATLKGKVEIEEGGVKVQATQIEIAEPRMAMQCFLSEKGDLIRADALGGMVLRPISREEALAAAPAGERVDLAEMTRLRVDRPLGNPAELATATYEFLGGDFGRAPRDSRQAITVKGKNWVVKVTAQSPALAKPVSIAAAAQAHPEWLGSGLNIPAADPDLRKKAAELVGKEVSAVRAAQKIGRYVHSIMKPNAGIGVLRDAREVFQTREGVCRDYAILTAALLRAARIPARLASGLLYHQDSFYYHAWVESWDGAKWYGLDATRPALDVTVGHIKLAQGSVEDAFLFTFLDRVPVKVLATTPKK